MGLPSTMQGAALFLACSTLCTTYTEAKGSCQRADGLANSPITKLKCATSTGASRSTLVVAVRTCLGVALRLVSCGLLRLVGRAAVVLAVRRSKGTGVLQFFVFVRLCASVSQDRQLRFE